MATVEKRWNDVEPAQQAPFDNEVKEKDGAVAHEVEVCAAADDRDPALIPTEEDLRTLPRIPAGMP